MLEPPVQQALFTLFHPKRDLHPIGFDPFFHEQHDAAFCDYLFKYMSGESERMPGVDPVQGLPGDAAVSKITEELVKRGYKDKEIELILGGNFLRVFQEVWK